MNISFLRNNAHALLGAFLLITFGGTALALYLEVPDKLKEMQAAKAARSQETADSCPHHHSSTAPAATPGHVHATHQSKADGHEQCDHNSSGEHAQCTHNGNAAHEQCGHGSGSGHEQCAKNGHENCSHSGSTGGCCNEKKPAAMVLPAGHPPVPGFTITSENPE